jgi:hypothetical protein
MCQIEQFKMAKKTSELELEQKQEKVTEKWRPWVVRGQLETL